MPEIIISACTNCGINFEKRLVVKGPTKWNYDAESEEDMSGYQRWWFRNKNLCEDCQLPYHESKCETPRCENKIHADGLCGPCITAKWRKENPEKLKNHIEKSKERQRRHTITIDFSKPIGTRKRENNPVHNRLDLLKKLEKIANKELRPLVVQAAYFIKEGIERYNKEKEMEEYDTETEDEDDDRPLLPE